MEGSNTNEFETAKEGKKRELYLFLTVTLIVFPAIAIGVVGGFGLVVWVYQLLVGPPGPPGG